MADILVCGCGHMGTALIQGWAQTENWDHTVTVVDPKMPPSHITEYHFVAWAEKIPALKSFDIVVLAIKPQQFKDLAQDLSAVISEQTIVLSVMAGITIASLERIRADVSFPVIRAMPNLPAMIGLGISAYIGNAHVTETHYEPALPLLAAVGDIVNIIDEKQMDVVTALSGSGPAYVFLFLESLTQAATARGIEEDTAYKLALHTLMGATQMILEKAESRLDVSSLRHAVTSPGGTTEAALNILLSDKGLPDILRKAINAATERSNALSV